MIDKTAENTVFRRYNTAIVVAFIAIVFIALAAASLRYYSELSEHKQRGLNQLTAQAEQLNTILEQSERAVIGIQEFAQYILKKPNELHAQLPPLRQDGPLFFLDTPATNSFDEGKRISGNITGFGTVANFSLLKQQEITMANALTPAFAAAQKVIEQANWFYYVSKEQFVNIYPWIGRDSWRFSDKMLTNVHAKKIQALGKDNNKVIWSTPYIDAAGTGMNFSLGIGVYRNEEMLGAVVIDISLARLQQSLLELTSDNESLVLLNQTNDVLLFKEKGKAPLSYRTTWQDILPKELHYLKHESLTKLPDSNQIENWLVEKQTLAVNGWTLVKYQPYTQFIAPLRSHFIFMFTILLLGLLAFLMLVNAMTRRSFIKPTHDFISHIEYCAQGDPGKVKATADWLHWFVLVEDIFTQNRSLLLQLKEQNEVLDTRVLEKTKALLETSTKHQRDYVLLRSVMNAIPELIIFNDPQGKLMGCNQAFEKLTGSLESDMFGFKASQFMPKLLAQEIKKLNENFIPEYPQQALIETGDEIYQGFCNQFANEQGEILGTITILQDVTAQQTTQAALENAKNQAENANKVKVQFLANMSHEIRTPINAIQGMLNLLTKTPINPRQEHYLANAKTAAFSLLHLIDELLDLSKIEAGKMVIVKELLDLPAVIDTALKLNSSNIDLKKLTLRVELAANIPRLLMSDEMRLVQVLSNLLNNAIKFTELGEVALLIDTIGMSDTNALVRFRVKDTGIGISTENQKHLFKAFSQADISMTRKYGGSGLGLSICQQIVKLLGGEITLKSDLGAGCEFSFILPLSIPTDKKIKSSAYYYDNNILPFVHIVSIGQALSRNCIDTIKSRSWKSHQLTDITELNNSLAVLSIPQEERLNAKIILLLNEDVLNNSKAALKHLTDVDLICLCQSTMHELNPKSSDQLDEVNVPYILLDTPLYRYSFEKIAQILANNFQEKLSEKVLPLSPEIIAVKPDIQSVITERECNTEDDLSNLHVLLVEDNLVNQLVAKELLLSMNAEVTIADNGLKAIEKLDKETFDVVLMDIQMPVMDGLTATEEIRKLEKFKQLPIIAMTAHAREEDKLRSLAAGMNIHIAKPVTAALLLKSILTAVHSQPDIN